MLRAPQTSLPVAADAPLISSPMPGRLGSAAGLLALGALAGIRSEKALAIARGERAEPPAALLEPLLEKAQAIITKAAFANVNCIGFQDVLYPQALRGIRNPPLVLWARGSLVPLGAPLVAVVGRRAASDFGLEAAAVLAKRLAARNAGIVNGMARGIDASAQQAAEQVQAFRVAVLARGLTVTDLTVWSLDAEPGGECETMSRAVRLLRGQAPLLVSEQPPFVRLKLSHYVARNRIITGLARSVVVVEADTEGGTMHAVRFALGQGRPLFVAVDEAGLNPSEGGRLLLESPARELARSLAWRSLRDLLDALGDAPVATAIAATADSPELQRLLS